MSEMHGNDVDVDKDDEDDEEISVSDLEAKSAIETYLPASSPISNSHMGFHSRVVNKVGSAIK